MIDVILQGFLGINSSSVTAILEQHSYLAIFVLMTLEAASLPVPSEIVLPLVGHYAHTGEIDLFLGYMTAMIGGVVGMGIDYYIAYYLEKQVVYKNLKWFHISKQKIIAFDVWFNRNGASAVFFARLLPIVRGLINFPAGFARMPIRKFYLYSIVGTAIWDALLIGFGYYALDFTSFHLTLLAVVAFVIVLYVVYTYGMKKIKKGRNF